jgi:cell division protease FtsH
MAAAKPETPAPKQPPSRRVLVLRTVLLVIGLAGLGAWLFAPQLFPGVLRNGAAAVVDLPYTDFKAQIRLDNVASVTFTGTSAHGTLKKAIPDSNKRPTTSFTSRIPDFADPSITTLLDDKRVNVSVNDSGGGFVAFLGGMLPFLLLIGLWIWIARRAGAAGQGLFEFGRNKARVDVPGGPPGTTFKDVAGVEEALVELQEIVDFLRAPQKFQKLGGRMPRGVLLVGPPGTGKTLLARAVAGEAQVPFFSISASEFVEMFVGVGAARVRSLFEEAKKSGPAVVFVDELDAVGRQRGAGIGGGNDEREQTLNQLLVEMDGFDQGAGIIVLAATNRPDILDPALLRPGRFDRRIVVERPDRRGRLAILKVHARNVPLAKDVDLDKIAGSSPGLAGADLANLVNEAALLAARFERSKVTMEDFDQAFDRLVLGAERRIVLSDEERRTIAFHESGHALVAWLEPQADPVRKITIIPRGRALGATHTLPTQDQYNLSEEYLRARLATLLGGRAAEEIALGRITTGAQDDLENATELARRMVISWGMSKRMGPFAFDDSQSAVFLGRELTGAAHVSQETSSAIDEEVLRILNEELATARKLLVSNRDRLGRLAEALLTEETLEEERVVAILGPRVDSTELAASS